MALTNATFSKLNFLQRQVTVRNILGRVRWQGLSTPTTTTGDEESRVSNKNQFRKDEEFGETLKSYRHAIQNARPTKYETMALLWCGYYDSPEDVPDRVSITVITKARHKVSVLFNMWMLCTLLFAGFTFVALQRARFEKIRKSALKRQLAHFKEKNRLYDEEYEKKRKLQKEKKEAAKQQAKE